MATVKIPVTIIGGHPTIPVTISNGDKKVTVDMIVDTGWQENNLDGKYARLLGYTATDIRIKATGKNWYEAQVKIGSLKPLETFVVISTGPGLNVLGAMWMRQFDSFVITRSSVTITDSTTGGNTMEGLTKIMADWNKYIHAVVGGPMLAATNKKQALFAASRSNAGAYWRNRM